MLRSLENQIPTQVGKTEELARIILRATTLTFRALVEYRRARASVKR
jgi:hypothetical protein